MKDVYKTVLCSSSSLVKVKGSKFIGTIWPVRSEDEIRNHLEESRKSHFSARHHCYAWRLGVDGEHYRANDDGEPGGTAGKPILGQLLSNELTGVLVIVVRYFGGTLLGTSGLIQAYREAAAQAISGTGFVERTVEDLVTIEFTYARMSQVMNAIKGLNLEMTRQDFSEHPSVEVAIRQSATTQTIPQLQARILEIHEAEVTQEICIKEGLRVHIAGVQGI